MLYFTYKMAKGKQKQNYSVPVLLSTLSSLLVIAFAIILFLLAKGYRVDFSKQEVSKTGAISIRPTPSSAIAFLDDEEIGRTPKSRVVGIGKHTIRLEKDGFHKWEKEIDILDEKTTIVTPWLILKDNKKYTAWNSEREIEKFWVNESQDVAILLLKEQNGTYSLWRYKIEKTLWEILNNPIKLWETDNKNIKILLSPDGNYALLTNTTEQGSSSYLLNTSTTFTPATNNQIDLTSVANHSVKWASDNKHLLFESKKDLLSYNITDRLMYSVFTKEEGKKYIWTSAKDGIIYLLKDNTEENSKVYTYSLEAISLDGVKGAPLVKSIYMQKDEKYIEYYRAQNYQFIPFTNSPENTQNVGEIDYIYVDKQAGGIFISTKVASYWYKFSTNKYMTVYPYPTKFISISGDNKRFMFESNQDIYTFTFFNETLNPLEEAGTKIIKDIKEENKPRWIGRSKHISYVKDGSIYISESDGENAIKILPIDNVNFFTVKSSRDNIVTFEKDTEEIFNINEYRL